MSTYVFMKVLESAPSRYDKGIRLLTAGRLDAVYDRLTSGIHEGQHVLDIGCGTGALTLRAAGRGAHVKGIDVDPRMLEIAAQRAEEVSLANNVELCELGIAELGSEPAESYDVVMSGLCFSELSGDERRYALQESMRVLRPGGTLLIADEVRPTSKLKRITHALKRTPIAFLTYVLTQTTTHAVEGLQRLIEDAGFIVERTDLDNMESFTGIVARKQKAGAL